MKKLAILILILGLVIFGCVAETPETSNDVVSAEVPEQEDTETEEVVPEQQDNESEEISEEEPLSDSPPFDLAAYVESGVPIKCDIETYEDGVTKRMVLYIKGYKLRVDDYLSPDGSERLALIMNGTDMYVPQVESPECDWLKISSKDGDSSTEPTNVSTVIDTPVTNYSCVEDVFGDEKFETPGKICDFWEAMSEIS